jgi:hypothetical protein
MAKGFKQKMAQKRAAVPQIDPSLPKAPAMAKQPQIKNSPAVEKAIAPDRPSKRYTTYLFEDQIKQIKIRAATTDKNDQEIVQAAIDEYFKNHPTPKQI